MLLLILAAISTSPFGVQHVKAATTLTTGDIAFIGYNSDNPDQFAFVLLVDVDADTTITFTDNGWYAASGFRATEGTGTITFNSTYQAGVQITVQIDPLTLTSSDGNNSNISWQNGSPAISLSTSGDQIFAYQGFAPTVGSEEFLSSNSNEWRLGC